MNDQSLYLLTEAADRTGLTVEALRQRIKRGKLEALKGNDGMLRVRLTTADLEELDRSAAGQGSRVATSQPVNDDRLPEALEEAAEARGEATALRERAERAEARAEAAQELADRRGQEVAGLRERAGRAEGESATLREQIAAQQLRAEARLREAEAARDAVRAELAEWTAGGPVARAVRAFLNRRGRG